MGVGVQGIDVPCGIWIIVLELLPPWTVFRPERLHLIFFLFCFLNFSASSFANAGFCSEPLPLLNPCVPRCFRWKSDAHWTHSLIQYIYLFGALGWKWDSRCRQLYCSWHKANHQRGPVIKFRPREFFPPTVLHVLQAESNLCASRLSGPPCYFLLPHMVWPFSSSTPPAPHPHFPPSPSPPLAVVLSSSRVQTND